jgi:hypothetical protein
MKLAYYFGIWVISNCIFAFDESPDIISQQGAVRIGTSYQSWVSGEFFKISELSTPAEFYIPLSPKFSINGALGYASVEGKTISSVYGLTDALFALSYYLEEQNVLLTLEFNYPGGKQELNPDQYITSVILSQAFYAFEIPLFGQDFNFSPGFTWAKPVSDKVVVGLGASYQVRGKYLPVNGMSAENAYQPGDEWLITAGLDVQKSEMSTFSVDLTLAGSKKDRIGKMDVFRAGQKVMAAVQYRTFRKYDLISFFLRYRSRSKAEIYGIDEMIKIQPDELECICSYRNRINSKTRLTYFLEARSFIKNDIFNGASQIGFGISPEMQSSASLCLDGRLKYIIGKYVGSDESISGIEIGAGIKLMF